MHKIILHTFVVVFMSSCTFKTKDASTQSTNEACIGTEKSVERKVQLENEIRGQVTFLGETENFSTITASMSEDTIPALSLAVINQGTIEWADLYLNPDFPEVQHLSCASKK